MAVSSKLYGNVFKAAFNKEIDLNDGNVKVALCTSSYTPDQDTHDYFDDVTNEVVGTGYTAGGAALTTPAVTYTAGTNVTKFDADDVAWANSTITARYAVIYYDTTVAATSPLIGYVDFGEDKSTTATEFKITWNAAGIFTDTVA